MTTAIPSRREAARPRADRLCVLAAALLAGLAEGAFGQAAGPEEAASVQLLRRLEQLEREVQEVHQLRRQVHDLQGEVQTLRGQVAAGSGSKRSSGSGSGSGSGGGSSGSGSGDGSSGSGSGDGYSGGAGSGTLSTGGGGGGGPNAGGTSGGAGQGSVGRGERVGSRSPAGYPIEVEYKYNFAGGYFSFHDEDNEFVLNVQNMLVADGTFYDRQNAPTRQRGFNIPYQRLYLYGNVTKNWEYQISEQSSLGGINLLDLLVNVHYDDRLMFKFGRFLAPFYYQDYATFPMLVPAVNYSPLFQFSAQRQVGAMAWGKLFENRLQYQVGVFNGIPDGFYDFDDDKDFIGSLTFTPFKQGDVDWLRDLGFGVSTEVGWQNYMLDRVEDISFIAGAGSPNLNRQFVTASGVPFLTYDDDVRALGERVRIAPHLFWYGRLSLLAEYVTQTRELADPFKRGISVQRGFYVTGSYFLTGERNTGDGTGGFPTIIPNSPFNPSEGEYGIGAWELAFQFSQLNVGNGDIRRGFASPIWATELNETMAGLNWWPNKYVRVSFDWVYDEFNKPIPWPVNREDQQSGPTNPVGQFHTFWSRIALFF